MSVSLSVEPCEGSTKPLQFVQTGEESWNSLPWFHRKPISTGATTALSCGPLLGYPVRLHSQT